LLGISCPGVYAGVKLMFAIQRVDCLFPYEKLDNHDAQTGVRHPGRCAFRW
jgi:hypothetical protein